ncbi:MAG TPA: hypothetical protein VFD01_07410 [Candidatus Dormibacteraeota bacterium]|jgi:hypothetical protein|nr:hypothetical protein [Candidatus Dormibacteraeota bacterium]
MSEPTFDRDHALAALDEVERRRRAVHHADPGRGLVFLIWGGVLLLGLPLFDLLPPPLAGGGLSLLALLGAVGTVLVARRHVVVRRGATRRYVITLLLWTAWYLALLLSEVTWARALARGWGWIAGGVLASLPFWVAALLERER